MLKWEYVLQRDENGCVAYGEWIIIPSAFHRGNYMDIYEQKNTRMRFFNEHKFSFL